MHFSIEQELRVKVLRSLAKHVPSALSRNWFNSEADLLETSKNESKESRTIVPRLENCDLGNTLKFMQVAIDPEMAGDTQLSVHCIVDGVEKHIKVPSIIDVNLRDHCFHRQFCDRSEMAFWWLVTAWKEKLTLN